MGGPTVSAASDPQAPASFRTKAKALRNYLIQNTSETEFQQVYGLVREVAGSLGSDLAAAEEAKRQVSDVLGSERSASLLPMFQLLGFLEDVAASLLGQGAADGELPSWESFRRKEKIISTFKGWDINGDGFISKEELQRVMRLLGVADEHIDKIFAAADTNADGAIDYAEFVHWLFYGSAISRLSKAM